ncbi:MAG: hypothetical protein C4301_02035 [Thermus sp.]|uniref:hypothetical protein n=1 Tax=Thermus sp. TaxID=275 RepID=UPI003321B59B
MKRALWILAFLGSIEGLGQSLVWDGEGLKTLIRDSYREVAGAPPFIPWFRSAFLRESRLALEAALLRWQKEGPVKAALEVHRMVKRLLPHFSLERGYEFAYAASRGERQCLLQSVLIAALLEKMGFSTGVYMVYQNPEGKESNLGHAVAVLKLGKEDLLVDASDPTPFVEHRGVFAQAGGVYRFLKPVYSEDHAILRYVDVGRGQTLKPEEVTPLPFSFVRSQFYYYRGEQTPGGFLGPATPQGLARSEAFLRRAVALEPKNPLATYLLGLVLKKEGREEEAKALLRKALDLYGQAGYIPPGPRNASASLQLAPLPFSWR